MFADILNALIQFAQWMLQLVLWVPQKLYQMFMEGMAAILLAIPVPAFFADAQSAFNAMTGDIMYFASAFRIGTGMTIIIGALVVRFLIRRIPVIG